MGDGSESVSTDTNLPSRLSSAVSSHSGHQSWISTAEIGQSVKYLSTKLAVLVYKPTYDCSRPACTPLLEVFFRLTVVSCPAINQASFHQFSFIQR